MNTAIATASEANGLHQSICACLPKLRSFSMFLAQDRTLADDLVQEAVVRALTYRDQFEPDTNFSAWIMTILRNCFYNDLRRRKWIADTDPEMPVLDRPTIGGQEARLEMRDFERAFAKLGTEQREALLLVGVSGVSYEEAAEVAGCAAGTMKSRVSRGRAALKFMLEPETGEHASATVGTDLLSAEPARSGRGPRRPIN